MADGPQAGLRLLDEVQGLESYHLFHATSGELARRAGDVDAARAAFTRARDLAVNPAERRLLERRLAELG
jgi:RNA polymerase sigma-70 factor (ECF subfamily)